MILTDTFIVENAELLIEQRNGKTIRRLRGIFGRCDEKNNNGRVYSKPLLSREVKRIAEAMDERRLLGELDHPTHDAVKLSNVSHLITGLDFRGNELIGECELLDTPAGKVAQALVEGGVKIGISSRGMGTLSEHADGTKHVNEDFKLVTFDLVADPSTRGAFPGISESSLVEEIVKDTLNKAAKEKVFTTMLKDKLREKIEGEGTQSAKWTKASVSRVQAAAKGKGKKPTVENPFKNWEEFYGWNFGKPRVVKTRSYPDADTVTAPAEVTENKFCLLKDVIVESNEDDSVSVLLQLLREAVKAMDFAKKREPGALKKLIGRAATGAGEALIGHGGETHTGVAGKMAEPGKASWKKGGMRGYIKARKKEKFLAKNPKPTATASDEAPVRKAVSKKTPQEPTIPGVQVRAKATSKKPATEPTDTSTKSDTDVVNPPRKATSKKYLRNKIYKKHRQEAEEGDPVGSALKKPLKRGLKKELIKALPSSK